MTRIETIEFTLPAFYASYLINGDVSGLNDAEQSAIDTWVSNNVPEGFYGPVDMTDERFARSHEIDMPSLDGDVATFTWMK